MTTASAADERPLGDFASQPLDPRREFNALTDALGEQVGAVERPAIRVGGAILAGIVAMLALLANVVPWLAWLGRLPWWMPLMLIPAAGAVLVAAMPLALLARRILDAWVVATYFWLRGRGTWSARTGEAYPDGTEAAQAWQAAHEDAPRVQLDRAGLLLALDRPSEALELLAGDAPSEHDTAFLHAQLAWLAAHMVGRDEPDLLDRCRALAATYPEGSDDRRVADASVDDLVALDALAHDADWIEPLARARRTLGRLARGIAFREMFLPRLRYYGLISAGIAAALIGLQLAVFALSA